MGLQRETGLEIQQRKQQACRASRVMLILELSKVLPPKALPRLPWLMLLLEAMFVSVIPATTGDHVEVPDQDCCRRPCWSVVCAATRNHVKSIDQRCCWL